MCGRTLPYHWRASVYHTLLVEHAFAILCYRGSCAYDALCWLTTVRVQLIMMISQCSKRRQWWKVRWGQWGQKDKVRRGQYSKKRWNDKEWISALRKPEASWRRQDKDWVHEHLEGTGHGRSPHNQKSRSQPSTYLRVCFLQPSCFFPPQQEVQKCQVCEFSLLSDLSKISLSTKVNK